MLTVYFSAEGKHEPKGCHFMVVNNHGLLIDLSTVHGTLHDPAIKSVTWGLVPDGLAMREGGTIIRQDGSKQRFFERAPLEPYLAAFEAKSAELRGPQPRPQN